MAFCAGAGGLKRGGLGEFGAGDARRYQDQGLCGCGQFSAGGAGGESLGGGERVAAHLEAARQQVQAMGDPRADESARQRAARQRAVRERQRGLEQALEQLGKIREIKSGTPAQESARVSLTDPEARIMKQSDGGYA